METKSFKKLAGFILIFCLVCQVTAVLLLVASSRMSSEPNVEENTTIAIKPPPKTEVPQKKTSPQFERLARKLKRLENQEEFLKFTENEMEIAKLFKVDDEHRHTYYYTAIMNIDLANPNLLEKTGELLTRREEYLQKDMDELEDFVAQADFSCLTDEEHELFFTFLDNRREWAKIAYDDSVDNETKLEVCRAWADVVLKIHAIGKKIYREQYGDVYEQFMNEFDDIGINRITEYTNPWWINRTAVSYRDADGKMHHLRVKLFAD